MNISEYAPEMQGVQPSKDMIAEALSVFGFPLVLCAMLPDGPPIGRHFSENESCAAVDWAYAQNLAGKGVYWHPNLLRNGLNKKSAKTDVVAARFVHGDLDPPKDSLGWTPDQRSEVIDALDNELPYPPSFIVNSGAGLQALWRLSEPCANWESIEAINKGIRDAVNADEGTWNIDRLLRVPGTWNFPNKRKRSCGRQPALCEIVRADTDEVFDAYRLAMAFPPRSSDKANAAVDATPTDISGFEPLTLDEMDISDSALVRAIHEPDGSDRHKDVYHAACEMVRCGFLDKEIAGILLNPANPISAHCLDQNNPTRAAKRAIGKARTVEGVAEGTMAHICTWPAMTAKLIENWNRKHGKPLDRQAANDPEIGIVRNAHAARVCPPFEFVRVGELQHSEPDWMVEGLFEASSLALLFGDPGSGKSFIAIDLAACIATGLPFHGREVAAGAVFYIAGEGHNGLRRRFSAWEKDAGVSLNDAPLFTSKGAANFLDGDSAKRVAEAVAALAKQCPPRLIIVDTLARSFGEGDENSTKDMNAFVRAMDNLRRGYPDAMVLIVHHSGHGDKGRARGAMALKGALDAEYRTAISGDLITLSNTKMKEASKPADMQFKLVGVELGIDRNGEPYGSARLQHFECGIGLAKKPLSKTNLAVVEAYRLAATACGDTGLSEGVTRRDWRETYCAGHQKPDSARAMWGRAIKTLCDDVPSTDEGLCFLKPAIADSLRSK